jgi:hypothetical protein
VSTIACYGTVLLDEGLRRSLSAVDGAHEVAWVYRCALEHGHVGDHHALVYHAGGQSYWTQWDESGRPRISTTDQPHAPGPEPGFGEQPDHLGGTIPPTTAADSLAATAVNPPGSPKPGSQDEALWAIAAALERLADVIAAAPNSGGDTGRHAASSHSEQSR